MMRKILAWANTTLLLTTLVLVASADSAAAYRPWGSSWSKNQVMKPRCASYPYRYRVNPPSKDWAAEIFLVGPHGRGIASDAVDSDADPARGRKSWRLCRPSITAGRYRIKMRVTWLRGFENHVAWVKPTSFRMRRR